MKNPISDKDRTMYPERRELLERAKNGTERDRMAIHDAGIEIFGRRVRIGTFYGDRADVQFRLRRGRRVEEKVTIGNRNMGFRYIFEISGDPDDWDLDPEYILEPFKRSYIGFRVVRNK